MLVINVTNAPESLRGHLSRWMVEFAPGTYVGSPSAKVRERLWDRVVRFCHDGRAVMIWSDGSALGFSVRVHRQPWVLEDFDGVQLPLRPSVDLTPLLPDPEEPPTPELSEQEARRRRQQRIARLNRHR